MALRFEMNVARRLPRTHGITVSCATAAFKIDLTKRALVFIAMVLKVGFLLMCHPRFKMTMTGQSGRFRADASNFRKNAPLLCDE